MEITFQTFGSNAFLILAKFDNFKDEKKQTKKLSQLHKAKTC